MSKNSVVINSAMFFFVVFILALSNSRITHAASVEVLDLKTEPDLITVGDSFSIELVVVNNSPNSILVHNSCNGPFTVEFDEHADANVEKICNWMPIQIILQPGKKINLSSSFSNLTYKATSSGIVNAEATLVYDIINEVNPDLTVSDNVISDSLVFTIKDSSKNQENDSVLSPLKQFKAGINSKEIICKKNLELILKIQNNSPACVKPGTANKLVLHGWMKLSDSIEEEAPFPRTVTLEDSGKSIKLKMGQNLLLKLEDSFEWNVEIDNQKVLSRVMNIMVVKGAQGVYETHSPGNVKLTAVGDPSCLHSDPPCKIHSMLFTLDIEVTP